MKKLSVFHLVEDLKTGGAERVIADIVEGLDRKRFEARVWCLARGGETADELLEKGVEVRILGIWSYHNPLNIIRLSRLLKKEKPDIVHTHGYFASVIGRLAAKKAGLPIIITHVHSTYWEYKKRHLLIERYLSRCTHRIICCSEAVKNFVTGHEKIKEDKTVVIYNGVDEERFLPLQDPSPARARLGIDRESPVVGTVSSLTPHKGQKYLIQAAAKIREKYPATRFLIVGDGPLRQSLEEQALGLSLQSSLIFTGARRDIPDLLSLMDIFVLPSSSREGLGIAIIEGMAMEKPTVATDIGGIPEVVQDGETGLLVRPGDSAALAKAIIELIDNPDRAKAMGKKGRNRFAQKFTRKTMLSKIEDLYLGLAGPKKDNATV